MLLYYWCVSCETILRDGKRDMKYEISGQLQPGARPADASLGFGYCSEGTQWKVAATRKGVCGGERDLGNEDGWLEQPERRGSAWMGE